MRKFYLFMLMAVGLLISTTMFAMPERPVPPTEPKAPEKVEIPLKHVASQLLLNQSVSMAKAASRKAPMDANLATIYREGVVFNTYPYTNEGYSQFLADMADGDSIVIERDLFVNCIDFSKSIILDLNGYTICGSEYGIYIGCTGNFKVMNGSILSTTYYQESSTSNYSYGIYVNSGNVTLDNVTVNSVDEGGAGYAVTIYDGSLVMNNCIVNGYNRGVNVYSTSGNYINVTQNGGSVSGGTYGVLASYATKYTLKSGQVSSFDTQWSYNYIYIYGGTVLGGITCGTSGSNYYTYIYIYGGTINGDIKYGNYYNYVTITSGEILGNIEELGDYSGGYYNKLTISGDPIIHGTIDAKQNTVSLTGGSYAIQPKSSYLGKDYSFGKPVNGFYPLIKAVAETGGYGFASVEEALADEVFDNTIKLMANVENATINKNTTLDLDIRSITGTLTITDGAKVSVKSFDTGNIHELVATKEDVTLYGGNYDFQPSTKATLADGLDERADYPSVGKYTVCQAAVASIFRGEGTPQEVTYWTLQDAINDAQAGEKILIKKDISILNGVTVAKGKDITIDLNGHIVTGQRNPTGGWQLVNVNGGKLTLMDNTDVNKDGTGKGKLSTANFSSADVSFNPTYAVNLIRNAGTLIIESGLYETFGLGQAAYCVDQYSGGTTTINGGKLISLSSSFAIRIFLPSSLDNKFYINGGIIESLWVQGGEDWDASNTKFTLHIQNATILDRLGIEAVGAEFDILLKNIVMTNHLTLTGDARSAYLDGKYVVDSVRISGYNLSANTGDAAFKHLNNGQYQFEDVYTDAAYTSSNWREKYPEEEGYFAVPHPTEPYVIEIYKSGQANIRAFMPYVMDDYGLICIDEENKWYEIRPTQNTTGSEDVPYHDGELGNPWHQNKTWTLEEGKDVVPQDTTPVLIDHNVYVEENTTAIAASIQIESDQTLTVKSGATLQILDAGALFKDETAKIIIEPNAVVTVGSNGVISQDMENILIEASATEVGNFLLHPDVNLNTQPLATVKMVANIGKFGASDYKWHRFAMPVEKLETGWTKNPDCGTILEEWSYDKGNWDLTEGGSTGMKPFLGYTITTQKPVTDIEYTFTGNLLGNHKSEIDFQHLGYGYFGNSYTGYILAKEMLNGFKDIEGIEGQVWMWNANQQSYTGVSLKDLWEKEDRLEDYEKEVAPMQTFILKTNTGLGATINIDYMAAIWSNPRYGLVEEPNAAPARYNAENEDNAFAKIMITAANGQSDEVRLTENDANEDAYENGIDATKYFNENHINVFVSVGNENYTSLYTNNLESKILTLQTMEDVRYTLTIGSVEGSDYALVDLQTGNIISLVEGTTYDFVAQPNSMEERFQVIRTHQAPTSMDKVVNNKAAKGIFTPLGQYIGESKSLNNLPSGVYFIDGVKFVK